jgi:hypothetical protein
MRDLIVHGSSFSISHHLFFDLLNALISKKQLHPHFHLISYAFEFG